MEITAKFSHKQLETELMNSMKLVIPLHSLYWSIHTKDESKRGSFGVNWLWPCLLTASFRVFCYEMKCNEMTSFLEFMLQYRASQGYQGNTSRCLLQQYPGSHHRPLNRQVQSLTKKHCNFHESTARCVFLTLFHVVEK